MVPPGGEIAGGSGMVPGGVPAGGVVDDGGGNKAGIIGITGTAGDVGTSGSISGGGSAELGGRTGGNLSIFPGGIDDNSARAGVSANSMGTPSFIGGIDKAFTEGSSTLTSACGSSDKRFPQRALAQLDPSVKSNSPFGILNFFFVQYTFLRKRYETY